MIIKHIQETDKFVVWNGFSHKAESQEFDTIEQAEQELKRLEEEQRQLDLLDIC